MAAGCWLLLMLQGDIASSNIWLMSRGSEEQLKRFE